MCKNFKKLYWWRFFVKNNIWNWKTVCYDTKFLEHI